MLYLHCLLDITLNRQGGESVPKQPAQLFISYARANSDLMPALRRDLIKRHYSVWVDQHSILGGQDWLLALEEAIESCALFLVILTPESSKSAYVRSECLYAQDCGKTIIPLLFGETHIPINLNRYNWIDLREDYLKGLQDLVKALRFFTAARSIPVQVDTALFGAQEASFGKGGSNDNL